MYTTRPDINTDAIDLFGQRTSRVCTDDDDDDDNGTVCLRQSRSRDVLVDLSSWTEDTPLPLELL